MEAVVSAPPGGPWRQIKPGIWLCECRLCVLFRQVKAGQIGGKEDGAKAK